ncbi:ATP-dependent DNA helicase, partial [Gemmatimonadota bacterium]
MTLDNPARPVEKWITPAVREALAGEITAAGGSEVFFIGRLSPEGMVTEAEVAARGDDGAVPVVAQAARPGDLVIHNHPSGIVKASGPDLEVASLLGRDGIGFAIIDNACRDIYVVVEPQPARETEPLDLDEVAGFFAPGGPLAAALEGYEPRASQVEMALAAAGTFNDGRVVVVEAGTGVGKSLAYLVPAILWATGNHRRVVVSTNTINLQEQLIGSDLPVLERAGFEFTAVLVKGRRNYACLRKADEVRGDPDLFADLDEEVPELSRLAAWAFTSGDGSLADLRPPPASGVWEQLATEADDCTRARCPFFNDCHFYRARKRAAGADILVVNHHLLFTDLALREAMGGTASTAVLPAYSHLVIDEAQHVEEVATSHFGTEINSFGLQRQLGRLQHRRRSTKGLLPLLLRNLLPLAEGDPRVDRILERLETEVRPALVTAAEAIPAHFESLSRAARTLMAGSGEENRLRVTEEVEESPAWRDDASVSCAALRTELTRFTTSLGRLLRDLDTIRDEFGKEIESPVIDISAITNRLNAAAAALARFIDPADEVEAETVRWLESRTTRKGGSRLTLSTAPIEVGPRLARSAFEAVEGALLTSATLSTGGTFDYISSRLGLELLERGRLVADSLASPFDHAGQVNFLIPEDMPDPTEAAHRKAVTDLLGPAITAAGGRSLILMTSYGMLQAVHGELEGPLAGQGIVLRMQGEAPRNDLLQALRAGAGEALLATDSFWEGIDVRGDALSLLVLTRLPFRVPSEPVLQARAEKLEREGGNAFTGLLLPMAILKFKQGMGRLIRHREDRGIAIVLDPRILTRRYGRLFLDSLDWGEPEIVSAGEVPAIVDAWFR